LRLKNRKYKMRGVMWNPDIDAVSFAGWHDGSLVQLCTAVFREQLLTAAHSIRTISMPAGCFSTIRENRYGPSEYLAYEEENASSVECSLWVERLEQVVVSQEDGLYALPFCIHFWRVDVLEEPWECKIRPSLIP
jgi:hypothetical protein